MHQTPTATTTTGRRRLRFVVAPVVVAVLATALTACGDTTDHADTVVPTDPSPSATPPPPTASTPAPSGSPSPSPSPSPKTSAGSPSPSGSPSGTRGSGTSKGGGTGNGGGGNGGGGAGSSDGSGGGSGSNGGGSGGGNGGSGGRSTPRPSTPTTPATPKPPTSSAVPSALLTTRQLPAGYVKTVLQNDPPTRSDHPGCLGTLNALESYRSARPGAVEARVTFAQSQSGPFLQEVMRWLPGTGARQDLEQAAAVLPGCGEFTIGWNDGMTGTERVVAHGSAGIGDASWHATVTTTNETFTVQETLVLVVVGKTLVVLSEAGSPTAPSRSRTVSLARTATASL
ncbi:hypothetical protein OG352_35485 [Streptomyces sp. NBC_01485]|uniref:hypothetical protein n=1 Tax=Streptomyces sp. NBC_01485 TaxID=2903884 RepID=UPI002E348A3F|nr:hypothetical protein [Streptomyces sp. NBC_01485]